MKKKKIDGKIENFFAFQPIKIIKLKHNKNGLNPLKVNDPTVQHVK